MTLLLWDKTLPNMEVFLKLQKVLEQFGKPREIPPFVSRLSLKLLWVCLSLASNLWLSYNLPIL